MSVLAFDCPACESGCIDTGDGYESCSRCDGSGKVDRVTVGELAAMHSAFCGCQSCAPVGQNGGPDAE